MPDKEIPSGFVNGSAVVRKFGYFFPLDGQFHQTTLLSWLTQIIFCGQNSSSAGKP
jgi:hypothetical protein